MTTNPNSANEINTLKEIYSAINRNDFSSIIKYFDADIVRVEPEGFPTSGTFRGIPAMIAHFQKARDTWAEGECKPEQFVGIKDCLIAFCKVHVRLKEKTEWIDGTVADVFKFKNGRLIYWRSFIDKAQALQWASEGQS
jgi:Ketosteroid isomerase-related protein